MRKRSEQSCVVCGLSDVRALTEVSLADGGGRVVLCGSHALIHRRTNTDAHTVAELVEALRDRRDRDRRAAIEDELAGMLTAAFSGNRRERDRRAN